MNEGNAILIIGAIFLHLAYNLDLTVTVFLVAFSLFMWMIPSDNERKKLLETKIEYLRAKIEYYKEKRGVKNE